MIPELPPRCNSWTCIAPDGRVRETFDEATAHGFVAVGWKVETTLDYLERINREIKAGSTAYNA